jgi:hypothetical protein
MTIVGNDGSSVWVKRLPNGSLTRLTLTGTSDRPTWTPDGRSVAYLGSRGGGGKRTAWMRRADGSNEEQLVNRKAPQLDEISFSPDGRLTILRTIGTAANSRKLLIAMSQARAEAVGSHRLRQLRSSDCAQREVDGIRFQRIPSGRGVRSPFPRCRFSALDDFGERRSGADVVEEWPGAVFSNAIRRHDGSSNRGWNCISGGYSREAVYSSAPFDLRASSCVRHQPQRPAVHHGSQLAEERADTRRGCELGSGDQATHAEIRHALRVSTNSLQFLTRTGNRTLSSGAI